jgi:hypothetical protein
MRNTLNIADFTTKYTESLNSWISSTIVSHDSMVKVPVVDINVAYTLTLSVGSDVIPWHHSRWWRGRRRRCCRDRNSCCSVYCLDDSCSSSRCQILVSLESLITRCGRINSEDHPHLTMTLLLTIKPYHQIKLKRSHIEES